MKKPILIDQIIKDENFRNNQAEINSKWYVAKPLPYYSWWDVVTKFYHAWLLLTNRAFAYQYAVDYFDAQKRRKPKK